VEVFEVKIDSALRIAGQSFKVERGEASFDVEAIKDAKEKQFQLKPDSGLERGDWLKNKITGKRFYVMDTDMVMLQGAPYALLADYKTETEREAEQREPAPAQVVTVNVQNAQGSIIGTQRNAELTANFDLRSLESRIERDGGEDKEELNEALQELRALLEEGETLNRGALSKFSGAMERHSWFTGAVAQILVGWATQAVV
jgi:hypothetical protein